MSTYSAMFLFFVTLSPCRAQITKDTTQTPPDLIAPGFDIEESVSQMKQDAHRKPDGVMAAGSGMATAQVTGIAAQLFAYAKDQGYPLSPEETKTLLVTTSKNGIVDQKSALTELQQRASAYNHNDNVKAGGSGSATAAVTGIAAQLFAYAKEQGYPLGPEEAKTLLVMTSKDGVVNQKSALTELQQRASAYNHNDNVTAGGSGMATAQVTGIAAQLFAYAKERGYPLNPEEAKAILVATSKDGVVNQESALSELGRRIETYKQTHP